ncbi:MAG: iron-containing alcohol dehydrogenase [Candidatus Promineifilaceae bacterium]
MQSFRFHLPTKVIFGLPAHEILPVEIAAFNARTVLLVSDRTLAQLGLVAQIETELRRAGLDVVTFTSVTSNPTSDEVTAGLAAAHEHGIDALIALGGGSPIDVAKGIALLIANGGAYTDYLWEGKGITHRSWPLIAVPTTAGTGSEVSKVAVVSDKDIPFKKGVLSPLMFPHVAIVDPELTRGLPPGLTAATGMDAFVHALEAFVGQRANPFTDELALSAMRTAWKHLHRATMNGDDMKARQQMMLAALWGGMAMDHAGLGLVHALSGPLTSHLHLHHGLANALILPHVVHFNIPAIPIARRQKLNRLFGLDAAASGARLVEKLRLFVSDLGLPASIGELNVSLEDIDWDVLAEETTRMVLIRNNPRPATQEDCRILLGQMA